MNCPNCQHESDSAALFCQNCGHRLNTPCPNCSTLNEADARFCKNCGTALERDAEAGGQTADTTLKPPIPGRYVTRHSERRVVTILFADVKGSTALAEKLDPEEWTEIMNVTFAGMTGAIQRYRGTVARLMGDSILAFFGAPQAHEDDPYRAIRASLDMLEDLRPFQADIRRQMKRKGHRPGKTDFELRIGIHTGLVVVGEVGSRPFVEYTAMGDAVNLASRLEQTALPGTIQISQDTYRLVAPLVEVAPLGDVEVKGKSGRFKTYRVIGLKEKRSGLRRPSSLQAPLVGRSRELGRLKDSATRLNTGYGQVVSLIGEAGLGKSRLIAELKSDPAVGEAAWVEAASLSFEASQPYGLVKRQLQSVLDITQDDSAGHIRKKINQAAGMITETEREIASKSLEMLFIQRSENGQGDSQVEVLQQELFEGVRVFWKHQAADHPLILVFDDLHWADPASVDLIAHLLNLAEDAPVLFLCIYRPDRQAQAWTLKQHIERTYPHRSLEITLQPLNAQDSNTMVHHLLRNSELPKEALDLILQKTEGNPFFVEEIVHELIEKGSLDFDEAQNAWKLAAGLDSIEIPDSLEALLIARLDRLDLDTRRTVQLAAVIGRSFYYRVLKMVVQKIDQLDHDLQVLQQNGLILEAARRPELEYMFRHVLTQEAAYNTILLSQRRQFHQQTGEVMERLFEDRLEEHAPLLAHHFLRSGDLGRAFRYFAMAAERASALFANLEAILHFKEALDLIQEIENVQAETHVGLLRGRGRAFETQGKFNQARADLENALQIAQKNRLRHPEWRGLLDLGMLWLSRDYNRAGDYFRQALEIARGLGDPSALGHSLNRLGNWYSNSDLPKEAIKHHQEALEIFEKLDDQRGLADTLDLLGMTYLLADEAINSADHYQKAIQLYRQLDNLPGLISSLTGIKYRGPNYQSQSAFILETAQEVLREGLSELDLARKINWKAGQSWAAWGVALVYGAHGMYEQAFRYGELGLQIAIEIQHRQWMAGGNTTMGYIYLDLLNYEQAIEHLEESLSLGREVDSQNWINNSSGPLAQAHILAGDLASAEDVLTAILSPETPMDSNGQRNSWIGMAELRLAQGKTEEALAIADRLVATALSRPPQGVITRLWLIRARAHLALGQSDQPETLLLAALENGSKLGEYHMLWRIQAMLGNLYQASGRISLAVGAFTQSQSIVERLAERIPYADVKALFRERAQAYQEVK